VTPSWEESDHPGANGGLYGPQWVPSVVNAIGESSFWSSDGDLHPVGRLGRLVRPRQLRPNSTAWALSFRVPLIVVSPYAKAGLRFARACTSTAASYAFVEEQFGLSGQWQRATRAPTICAISLTSAKRRRRTHRFRRRFGAPRTSAFPEPSI
jgi:hypothetical protein